MNFIRQIEVGTNSMLGQTSNENEHEHEQDE